MVIYVNANDIDTQHHTYIQCVTIYGSIDRVYQDVKQ
jgi:hypothetical protein